MLWTLTTWQAIFLSVLQTHEQAHFLRFRFFWWPFFGTGLALPEPGLGHSSSQDRLVLRTDPAQQVLHKGLLSEHGSKLRQSDPFAFPSSWHPTRVQGELAGGKVGYGKGNPSLWIRIHVTDGPFSNNHTETQKYHNKIQLGFWRTEVCMHINSPTLYLRTSVLFISMTSTHKMRRDLQNQPYKFQTLLQRWKYKEIKTMEFCLQTILLWILSCVKTKLFIRICIWYSYMLGFQQTKLMKSQSSII